MVAYSFQQRFLEPIRLGEKRQTIRLPRKRHARQGETLQMFTGPRMKPVRVGSALCASVQEVRLDFQAHQVLLDDAIILDGAELDDFAIRDGFRPPARFDISPWAYMAKWWALTHPDQPVFAGVMIGWETFEATVLEPQALEGVRP